MIEQIRDMMQNRWNCEGGSSTAMVVVLPAPGQHQPIGEVHAPLAALFSIDSAPCPLMIRAKLKVEKSSQAARSRGGCK